MVLKGHQQIIFVENLDPIPAEKVVWHKDSKLSQIGIDLEKAALPARGKQTAQPRQGDMQTIQTNKN